MIKRGSEISQAHKGTYEFPKDDIKLAAEIKKWNAKIDDPPFPEIEDKT